MVVREGRLVPGWRAAPATSGPSRCALAEPDAGALGAALSAETGQGESGCSLIAAFEETVTRIGEAIDAREMLGRGHSERVALLSACTAAHLRLGLRECQNAFVAGLLHDIGKTMVSSETLCAPGSLDGVQWSEMREHAVAGSGIVALVPEFVDVVFLIRHHHERPDGGGYPDGLAGEAIPRVARIIAVCDTYDAMTSDRVYKEATAPAAARLELLRVRGSQLDHACVNALLAVLPAEVGEPSAPPAPPPA